MKLSKVLFEYWDEDGNKFRRTLERQDAEKWHSDIIILTSFAEEYNINPSWQKLNWTTEKIMSKFKPDNNSVLLSDIVDYDKLKK